MRLLIFSFKKILCKCSFTVPGVMLNSRAISLFDKPRATSWATSPSRGLSALDQSRNAPSLKATTQLTYCVDAHQKLAERMFVPASNSDNYFGQRGDHLLQQFMLVLSVKFVNSLC